MFILLYHLSLFYVYFFSIAPIIRTFVEKIIVYEAEKNDGVKTQKVKIVYNCVGTVSVPNTDNEPVKTDKTKIIEVA